MDKNPPLLETLQQQDMNPEHTQAPATQAATQQEGQSCYRRQKHVPAFSVSVPASAEKHTHTHTHTHKTSRNEQEHFHRTVIICD